MPRHRHAVAFKVRYTMPDRVSHHDAFTQHRDMPPRFLRKVPAYSPVIVHDEHVRRLALLAVDRLFERTVECRERQRCDGVGPGFYGGDDVRHKKAASSVDFS